MQAFESRIFSIGSARQFSDLALEVFRFQAKENAIYRKYLKTMELDPLSVKRIEDIPFLPIEFFKHHEVISGKGMAELTFESSGTSGQVSSKHFVVSKNIYIQSLSSTFSQHYGNPEDLCILALLPSYLERNNSSLVFMMNYLIGKSKHPDSGFYLDELASLNTTLKARIADKQPTLLLGVSFALLDLAEQFPLSLSDNIIVMETGGMKGRRKELVREELHAILNTSFGTQSIHSEYGMTELLSQAYAATPGRYTPPAWMKVLIRDTYDPKTILPAGHSGGINVIDLANLYSCSFIETSDLGMLYPDGTFNVTGRFDAAEVRGCNLMVGE